MHCLRCLFIFLCSIHLSPPILAFSSSSSLAPSLLVIVRQGRWGYRRVIAAFRNENIVNVDGELDREALAALVFRNPSARRSLNTATHLPILFEILRRVSLQWLAFRPITVIDMPLLFETGFFRVTRPNVVVSCERSIQLHRLQTRDGLDADEARKRIEAQMPLERKKARADFVIENNESLDNLKSQVSDVVNRLKKGALVHRIVFSPAGILAALMLLRMWL